MKLVFEGSRKIWGRFRYRDIHLAAWGFSKEMRKAAGMEIKWDANRDPNQKLAITVDFTSPKSLDYKGNFILSYPGRTINGALDFIFIRRSLHMFYFYTCCYMYFIPNFLCNKKVRSERPKPSG